MGAFDQFKQQADKVSDTAKEQLGKRGKSAGAGKPERMDRGRMQDAKERGSESEEQMRERMDGMDGMDRTDRDSEAQDDWA